MKLDVLQIKKNKHIAYNYVLLKIILIVNKNKVYILNTMVACFFSEMWIYNLTAYVFDLMTVSKYVVVKLYSNEIRILKWVPMLHVISKFNLKILCMIKICSF